VAAAPDSIGYGAAAAVARATSFSPTREDSEKRSESVKKRSTLWYSVQVVALLGLVVALVGCTGDDKKKEKEGKDKDTPLKVAYSDWPGWLVWEIAVQKDFFKDAGVNVEMSYMEYGKTIDAFAAGKVDGVCVVCGDALKIGDNQPSTAIVLTDYSNGNDMIIGGEGIDSIKGLKGKRVGVELNVVEHLLLVTALEKNGMKEEDVTLVGISTDSTPASLRSKNVQAIGAWYPISGEALEKVPKAKALFTSENAPGLIYDALHVNRKSLSQRRDDWKKVVGVWFKCLDYLEDDKTRDDAVKIMAKKVGAEPDEFKKNLKGTKLLDRKANLDAFKPGDDFTSVQHSMKHADKFYVNRKVYGDARFDSKWVDDSLVKDVGK